MMRVARQLIGSQHLVALFIAVNGIFLFSSCVNDSTDEDIEEVYLTGILEADTTIGANMRLRVGGVLTIPVGIDLTIEEGVEVACSSGVVVLVLGELIAIGTASDRITFDAATGADWQGVTVEYAGITLLEYVDVNNAVFGVQYYGLGSELSLCTFQGNSQCGIYVDDVTDPVTVTDCVFSNNTVGIKSIGSMIDVFDCTFTENTEGGIIAQYSRCIIRDCLFESNFYGFWSHNHDSSEVVNCDFYGNETSVCYTAYSYIYLTDSIFDENVTHLMIAHQHYQNRHNLLCEENNFLDFTSYSVSLQPTPSGCYSIPLGINYYNTADTAEIEEMVYDFYDNPDCDTLIFIPFAVTPF